MFGSSYCFCYGRCVDHVLINIAAIIATKFELTNHHHHHHHHHHLSSSSSSNLSSKTISSLIMSTNAVVGGHYGSPLDGSQPSQPPPGLVVSGPPVVDHTTGTAGTITSRHDINEILQQIMNITDQSLDEAQASFIFLKEILSKKKSSFVQLYKREGD
ncbi:Pre-B-cell leukemia transcription factor 1, variant 3 [Dermatophagoides farinae]|uniref:Pre-B-cell leukemia transcription factor 1, variant 3 n=1 Tax=Dermatophagoides farinae TaxID=6954 RepID=A0A922IF41_DERFA|nr:Pre-B-cell leukemia transcription factor 1, variant 3 [Dermatophagoides farinae]